MNTISEKQQSRIDKIYSDEFYIIGFDDGKILLSGSKKDVYTIKLNTNLSFGCNCPDSMSHARKADVLCKHICFIYIKILHHGRNEPINMNFFDKENRKLTQNNFEILKKKLSVFSNFTKALEYQNIYNGNTDRNPNSMFTQPKRKIDLKEECCPICMDEFIVDDIIQTVVESKPKQETKTENKEENKPETKPENKEENKEENKPETKPETKSETKPETKSETKTITEIVVKDTVFCPNCSNAVHIKCMTKWLENHKLCVYCRSDVWLSFDKKPTGTVTSSSFNGTVYKKL